MTKTECRTERWNPVTVGAVVRCHPGRLEQPLHWRKPRIIFVGDLFHPKVPDEFRDKVFAVMHASLMDYRRGGRHHIFQVLTKRPELVPVYMRTIEELPSERDKWDCPDYSLAPRIGRLAGDIETNLGNKRPIFSEPGCGLFDRCRLPLKNLWLGTTVENSDNLHRIEHLVKCPAVVRFLSFEPLLGPTDPRRIPYGVLEHPGHTKPVYMDALDNSVEHRIDQIMVGGESGPGARPMEADWVLSLRDQCVAAGVAFFFKQWGQLSNNPDPNDPTAKENGGTAKGGRMLDGRTWDEMPSAISRQPSAESLSL